MPTNPIHAIKFVNLNSSKLGMAAPASGYCLWMACLPFGRLISCHKNLKFASHDLVPGATQTVIHKTKALMHRCTTLSP